MEAGQVKLLDGDYAIFYRLVLDPTANAENLTFSEIE